MFTRFKEIARVGIQHEAESFRGLSVQTESVQGLTWPDADPRLAHQCVPNPFGDFATQSKLMSSSIEFDIAFAEDLQCAFDEGDRVGAARFRHRLKCQMTSENANHLRWRIAQQ
jgi:hypothetical protein